ncbi:MAG: tetratricopeptide repeat protein [Bryobacteraceae bacterium]
MTRHELKAQLQHDHFTDAVSDVISYARSNRQQIIPWMIAAVIVLAVAGGAFWYSSYKNSLREQDLQAAFDVLEAPTGPAVSGSKSYPTQDAKQQASMKALSDVVAKDGGSRQGLIAQYYLGTLKAQKNDAHGAESDLRAVADSRSKCAPLAKIALAELYAGENRIPEAQGLLRALVNKPADLVSKGQAQILLARLDETSNPQEAKKILQSLKGPKQDPAVARAADQLSAQMAK